MYEGMNNDDSLDLHLNGNAVYCLKSAAFSDYRKHVSRILPENGCFVGRKDDNSAGFDHALFRFRLRKENSECMKGKLSYFRKCTSC